MRETRTGVFHGLLIALTGLTLSLLLAGSAWALTATDCATCHGADVVEGHHDTTDPNSYFSQGLCGQCHVGVTTGNDCSLCHTFTLQNNTHHVAQNGTPIDCSQCHAGGNDIGNCLGCHAGSVQTRHHQIAAGGVTCNACHPAMVQQQSCGDCHGSTRERHHAVGDSTNVACTSCHTTMTAIPDCRGCHIAGSARQGHHDSLSSCSDCHSGAQQIGGCADCHQGATRPDHHALPAYASNGCGACHTSAPIDDNGCDWCHTFNPEISDRHHNDPGYIWVTYQLGCNGCHISAGNPFLGLKTTCIDCHQSTVGTTGTTTRHHAKAPAQNGDCAACHQAGLVNGSVCEQCHGVPGNIAPPATAQSHHASSNYQSGNCGACHAINPVNAATCASCHAAQAPIATTHHQTIPAQMNQCFTCHSGIPATSLACANCHVSGEAIPIAQRHHESPIGQTGACSSCHDQADPAAIPCSLCHTSARHHLEPQAVAGDCAYCHGSIEVVGASCSICHTLPMAEFHHDAPLASVGGSCAVCHSTINDPGVCANCHVSSPHHTTTWSQAGDCAHCHSVPAGAADRPAQAACRECHGTTMHDKGGPIQNYGICAACHNTIPFHPAPTSNPGYTGYGAGKKKFNMFWSKYSERAEDLSPNGDDLNDEGGDKIKAQQLPFSTTRITSNGRQYTVPYFTGMPIINLTLNKTASASRTESGYDAALAIDGNITTRWWAKSTNTQWLKVDLGAVKSVSKVALRWHSYYAKKYQLQVSTDNNTWTTVFSNSYGAGGMETRTFTARSVRYIRIYCQTASSSNGYSIYELEAYAQ